MYFAGQNFLQKNYIFHCARDLEFQLSRFGISCECLVLEKGFFEACLSVKSDGIADKIILKFNKKVVITGDKPDHKIRFSYYDTLSSSENDWPSAYGQLLRPSAIAGFGGYTETSCVFPAGVTSIHYSLPKDTLKHHAKRDTFYSFMELCEKTNHIELDQTDIFLLKDCLKDILSSNRRGVLGVNFLLNVLTLNKKIKSMKVRTRYRVAHDFLRWCHGHTTGESPHLEDISKDLFVSRRTLIQSVQENFQRGPAEILKMTKLQHCNHLLKKAGNEFVETDSIGLNSVNDIMRIYGFRHRGSFAQSFKNQFGCLPNDMLSRDK